MQAKQKQSRLEFLVAIGFSIIIFGLSSTQIGYIPLAENRFLDMGIIPAIFAAMIGGYRVGIPVALIWGGLAYINPTSNLEIYPLWAILLIRLVLVTTAYASYKVCKKYWKYSPANVYKAVVAAVTAKNLVASFILLFLLNNGAWVQGIVQQYVVELALCLLAMALLIKHLRQVHILNGVKRREKANQKRCQEADSKVSKII